MRKVLFLPLLGILLSGGWTADSVAQSGSNVMDAMNVGMKSLDSGDYQAAVKAFSRVIDSHDEDEDKVRALVLRAYCHLRLQDPYSAVDDLGAARRLDVNTAERLYADLTARLFHDPFAITDNLLAEFLQELSAKLVAHPHDPGLYLERASELRMRGFETDSETKLFSALTLCDATMAAVQGGEYVARALRTRKDEWRMWGDLTENSEADSRAADDIDQLRREVLYFGDYNRDHVLALLSANRDQEAMNELNDLIPDCSELFKWRGQLFARNREYTKALEDFADAFRLAQGKTGLRRTVDLAGIRWERAQIQFELGDYQAAIGDLDVAVKEASGYVRPFAYILRARCREHAGDHKNALADLDSALDAHKDPLAATRTPLEQAMMSTAGDTVSQVYLARALFFADQGRYAEAMKEAEKGVMRSPELAEAYFVRGAVYRKMGDTNKAEQDREKASGLDPSIGTREFPEKFETWSEGVLH